MKLGKKIDETMLLVECEQGMEVGGERTTEELYADGYKDVCEVERPSDSAWCSYEDYGTCYVQVWHDEEAEYRELEENITTE